MINNLVQLHNKYIINYNNINTYLEISNYTSYFITNKNKRLQILTLITI